ncbi:MAG: hypothetical protein KGL10_06610 [Alphaproteobacteria bacterium]|nr:hypothetical protein [Alphaproteobacteria bacterium]MDE2336964.1 hypothetical protein [Alphaproteobacteria bacterium]
MQALPSSPSPEKKSLSDIFNKFAEDAVERFPHLKGQLLVVNMDEKKVYAKDIDTQKTGLTKQTALDYISKHPLTKAMEQDKGMSSAATRDEKRNLKLVFMNESVSPAERDNVSKETEQHLLYVMDHELAHTAIKDGFSKDVKSAYDYNILLGESVADAYAQIRHYQRFGVDDYANNKYVSPAGRAENFILGGDSVHFTSFVLDAINKLKHEIDFDSLTPQQTADLARRFALEYMPPKRVVQDLSWSFAPVRNAFRRNPADGIKALADKTLDPNADYYTFKFGSMWLRGLLEMDAFPDGRPINLPKPYLDDLSSKLKDREEKFEKKGLLFDMPTVQKPKPPAAGNVAKFNGFKSAA